MIESLKKCSKEEIKQITVAFSEQLQLERGYFEETLKNYLDDSFKLVNQNIGK